MLSSSKKISSQVFKVKLKKKSFKTKHFIISYVETKKKIETQYAVIISKKVGKTAVLRNKNKRIIYNIISQTYPQFLSMQYCFIYIQKDISKINYQDLIEELYTFLKKK